MSQVSVSVTWCHRVSCCLWLIGWLVSFFFSFFFFFFFAHYKSATFLLSKINYILVMLEVVVFIEDMLWMVVFVVVMLGWLYLLW